MLLILNRKYPWVGQQIKSDNQSVCDIIFIITLITFRTISKLETYPISTSRTEGAVCMYVCVCTVCGVYGVRCVRMCVCVCVCVRAVYSLCLRRNRSPVTQEPVTRHAGTGVPVCLLFLLSCLCLRRNRSPVTQEPLTRHA